MNLRQRFQRYFIGVVIGLGMVFFFFGNRSCTDWMPNKRVLKRLSETEMIITKKARCEMDCRGLVNEDLLHLLRTGDVSFKESDAQSEPLIYKVKAEKSDGLEYAMTFEARDSSSTLIVVGSELEIDCVCD